MTTDTDRIWQAARILPIEERAALAELLLSSLDLPEPRIDELWAREAEDRLAASDFSETDPIPADEVFRELDGI